MNQGVAIRLAAESDLAGIHAIYDPHVLGGVCTFETTVRTEAQRREWLAQHHPVRHPCLVAVVEQPGGGERVVGWATLSAWSPRAAYARTAESSVYVAPDQAGRGVGRSLMDALLAHAIDHTPVRVVVARIVQPNDASNRLHRALGFAPVGLLRRCGEKFAQLHDVLIMDLHLDGG
jgi:phosphinothricin acetyltransferase